MVGRALRQKLFAEDVCGTYCRQIDAYHADDKMFRLDATDGNRFTELLQAVKPQVIISCMRGDFAAQLCLHRRLTKFLKGKEDSRLIYFSTANVFDNSLTAPHYENDTLDAKSEYGVFKMQCEALLREALGSRCVILRIPEVWGKDCPRLSAMKAMAKNGQAIHVYENDFLNYTLDSQIADCVQEILQKDLRGVFHVGTSDMCSHAEFRRKIAKQLHLAPLFEAERSEENAFQAVLTARSDLPAAQYFTIDMLLDRLFQSESV